MLGSLELQSTMSQYSLSFRLLLFLGTRTRSLHVLLGIAQAIDDLAMAT